MQHIKEEHHKINIETAKKLFEELWERKNEQLNDKVRQGQVTSQVMLTLQILTSMLTLQILTNITGKFTQTLIINRVKKHQSIPQKNGLFKRQLMLRLYLKIHVIIFLIWFWM